MHLHTMWDYQTLRFLANRSLVGTVQPRDGSKASNEELKKRKATREAAIALWWDGSSVTVYCPFCHKTHNHGIQHFASDEESGFLKIGARGQYIYNGPSPERCESRVAHCNHDVPLDIQYTILFPFEADPRVEGLSFETEILPPSSSHGIGKRLERFRTVGLDVQNLVHELNENESEDKLELRRRLQRVEIDNVDFDVPIRFGDETIIQKASILLISDSISGNLLEIRGILGLSSHPTKMANIRDNDGSSLLALATQNGHIHIVRYLVEHGANVNSTDMDKRTPLMEAALWGHVEILDFLLWHGANRHRNDKDGMQASDFAVDSERNDEERHERHRCYREDPFVKKRHRRLIRALLGKRPSIPSVDTISSKDLQDAYFHKSSDAGTISFVIPGKGIRISTQQKTAAFLNRGRPFPVVGAKSGWTDTGSGEFATPEAGFRMLDAAYWTPAVLDIAKTIGFSFEPHRFDHKNSPGSYFASHVEAQLMCFFIHRNYLFRKYDDGQTVQDDFLQLFLLQRRNRHAQIIISSPPCYSCQTFADRVRQALDVHFDLVALGVYRKYKCPKCANQWEAKLLMKSSYCCLICGDKRSDWEFQTV